MATDDSNPFIESPDYIDDTVENGLLCFLNDGRQCGPACMAYTTVTTDNPVFSRQQRHCALLVSVERLSRFSGALVQQLVLKKKEDTNAG